MRQSLSLGLMAALTLLALALTVAPAGAETVNCTVINAVPFTIASSGIYCLNSHLNTNISSGSAITVNADNVVIDLNGHVLSNNGPGGGTQARGVFSNNRRDVTVSTARSECSTRPAGRDAPGRGQSHPHRGGSQARELPRQRVWVIGQSSTVRRNVVRDPAATATRCPIGASTSSGKVVRSSTTCLHIGTHRHLSSVGIWWATWTSRS
jgi:hypothetical protein